MTDKRIAIIAVHGVGHHEPGESAHAIADLLGNPPPGTKLGGSYCPFTENHLRLPAQRLETVSCHKEDQDVGYNFMLDQLKDYQSTPPEDTYDTVELKSRRTAGNDAVNIDVYEMFWSDLSRLGTGFLSVFGELYQILFHLARLGAHSVKAACHVISGLQPKAGPAWRRFDSIQEFASLILTAAIPISNLVLLPLFLIPVAADWQGRQSELLCGIVTAAFIAVPLLLAVYALLTVIKNRKPFWLKPALWLALPVNAAILAAAARVTKWPLDDLLRGSMTVAYMVAGAGVYLIVSQYSRYRPEIEPWGAPLSAGLTVTPIAAVLLASDCYELQWGLRCAELAYWLVRGCWLIFFLGFLLAWVGGKWALLRTGVTGPSPQRTEWTARLTLALPAALFMLVTVAIWFAILTVLKPLLSAMQYAPFETLPTQLNTYIDSVFLDGSIRMFPTMFILLLAGLLLAGLGLAPVVWADLNPPKEPDDPKAHPSDQRKTEGMGIWLSTGFALLRGSGELIYLGMVLTALLGIVYAVSLKTGNDPTRDIPWLKSENAKTILEWIGGIFGGAAVTLIALRGRLEKVASGARTFLNIALDVDNYIRDDPRDSTPRARICARYASLLRHVAGQPYDEIVIIAHSQGTVITADLLRFLHIDQTALNGSLQTLRHRHIKLFTMGNPMGQLYGLRFPYLYHWARDDAKPFAAAPATALGVERWINAYRSGDYVGRSLWSSFDPAVQFGLHPRRIDKLREEVCIGQGAHTHYWDSHGAKIAAILDELIG